MPLEEKNLDVFPGKQMHSSTYKEPSVFTNQNVVLIGAQASGEDISRDIATKAKSVYLSAKTWQNAEWGSNPNISENLFRKPNVKALLENGSVEFEDGSVVENVDAIVYCIGYEYDFPFLDPKDANFTDSYSILFIFGPYTACGVIRYINCVVFICP